MTGAMSYEVEARRALVGASRAERLEALARLREVDGTTCTGFELREQVDRYHDLSDGRLAAGDRALRLREVGGERLLTYKGPAEVFGGAAVARVELELPWSPRALELVLEQLSAGGIELAAPVEGLPEEADAALAALGLVEVQRRATRRRAALLERDGEPVAELCLDEVRYRAGARQVVHREVEVESRGATGPEELVALADALCAADGGAWLDWPWSKTALGVALDALEARGELAELLVGEELTDAGHARVDAWLRAQRS